MAMMNCPECGREVSDKAKSCPNCGTPIKKLKNALSVWEKAIIITIVFTVVAVIAISVYAHWYRVREEKEFSENFWSSEEGQKVSKAHDELMEDWEAVKDIKDRLD